MFTFGRIKDKVVAVLSLLARQRKIRKGQRGSFIFASIDPDPVRRLFPNEANLQVGQVSPQNLLRR